MHASMSLGPRVAMGVAIAVAIAAGGTACTVESPDDNPFGTTPPMTSMPPASDTGDGTETGGSSGVGETSTGGPASTSGVDSSSGGPPLTTGVSMGDSTTGGGGDGMQPLMGMWAACAVPEECSYSPALCITITDDMMMLLGGFCSDVGCQNPAADCEPSPNGVAVPSCVPVMVNGMADMACALQCAGPADCPAPMQCRSVTGLGQICA